MTILMCLSSLSLAACSAAGQVPSAYVKAQSYLIKADKLVGDANKAMMAGDFSRAIGDYKQERTACQEASKYVNGPDSMFNHLLSKFSKDCISYTNAQIVFMNNPSVNPPTTENAAVIDDIMNLNIRWKSLGY